MMPIGGNAEPGMKRSRDDFAPDMSRRVQPRPALPGISHITPPNGQLSPPHSPVPNLLASLAGGVLSGDGGTTLSGSLGQGNPAQTTEQYYEQQAAEVTAFAAAQRAQHQAMLQAAQYESLASDMAAPFRQLKVEDALSYLDLVKAEFQDRPDVYNRFLDIMKDFKAQTIDTPGVIARVSDLFRGHRDLIIGFNTFLPPGYKIEDDFDRLDGSPPSSPRPPVEFDQAINYVTRIKTRFQDQPEIYRAFLDILHTYQKEQRGIKEVTTEVADLFREHTDLLDEFTNFLPERAPPAPGSQNMRMGPGGPRRMGPGKAARGKPKEKGKKGQAAVSNSYGRGTSAPRRTTARRAEELIKRQATDEPGSRASAAALLSGSENEDVTPTPPPIRDRERDREERREREREKIERERDRDREREERRERDTRGAAVDASAVDPMPVDARRQMLFFEKVKRRLNSPQLYREFLKCLSLFSQEVLNSNELVTLVRDLLGKHQDLFKEFKAFVQTDERNRQKAFADVESSMTRRFGPSYRMLPRNYTQPRCTGRILYLDMPDDLFNDKFVSVPMGSEDFVFKSSRKNQYEEVMFKAEDERFELDRFIEQNSFALKLIDKMLQDLSTLRPEDAERYDFTPLYSAMNLKAIHVLYQDKASDMIAGIRQNPVFCLPIVLRRMKQKDLEWRKARRELGRQWVDVFDKSYNKSLDHQSFTFKQNEKRALSAKTLLLELTSAPNKELSFTFGNAAVHEDIIKLFAHGAAAQTTDEENDRISKFLKSFLRPFLALDELAALAVADAQVSAEASAPAEPVADAMQVETSVPETTTTTASAPTSASPTNGETNATVRKQTPTPSLKAGQNPPDTSDASDATRPLALALPASGEQVVEPVRCPAQLIYGNSTLYMFLRLHQVLYQRLLQAKELAKQAAADAATKAQAGPPYPAELLAIASGQQPRGADKKPILDGEERYKQLIILIKQLLDSDIDQTKYEDDVRELLGYHGFFMFTASQLISNAVTQLQQLVTEEASEGMLNLYSYERVRTQHFSERVYLANSVEVLRDSIFRIFMNTSTRALQVRFISDLPNPPHPPRSLEERWSQYVVDFVGSDKSNLNARKRHVYRVGQLEKQVQDGVADKGPLVVKNGLECKICVKTCKLFFVENTEDFFYRDGTFHAVDAQEVKEENDQRREKFNRWQGEWLKNHEIDPASMFPLPSFLVANQ